MKNLKQKLENLINTLSAEDRNKLKNILKNLISVYPFNEYEYIISTMLGLKKLTLEEYTKIRDEYVKRNKYLNLFEETSKNFGMWSENHLKDIIPEFQESNSNDHDFKLINKGDEIKIEIKSSRAVDKNIKGGSLISKALYGKENKPFLMNFQQLKPKCCDVFVWLAVWSDIIKYWVFASKEIENNKYYSKRQHRGNIGEGQLHLNQNNIKDFVKYEVKPNELLKKIIAAHKRQNSK